MTVLSNSPPLDRTNNRSSINTPKCSSVASDLDIVLLNICGLKAKLKNIDFEQFIQKHQIVFLTETKLGKFDEIIIPGFKLLINNRQTTRRASGGVAILVHESIVNFVKVLDFGIKETIWIKISRPFSNIPVVFGLVYAPPADSPYADPLMILKKL